MSTTLFSEVPANITELRRRLFSLEEPLELPREEWDKREAQLLQEEEDSQLRKAQ